VAEAREHPVFGTLTWSSYSRIWRFEAGQIDGRPVSGVLAPRPGFDPLSEGEVPRIRRMIAWVLAYDLAIRSHITEELWDWWRAYNGTEAGPDTETTPEQFRDTLQLRVIRFDPGDGAVAVYDDQGMVEGYGVLIRIGPEGQFRGRPWIG
jgi:hypothetical protein